MRFIESDAIRNEKPAEIMTIKVISGFAKVKKPLPGESP